MKNSSSGLLWVMCLLWAVSTSAQSPFSPHAVRLSRSVAIQPSAQTALEYEYRRLKWWSWMGQITYRKHRHTEASTTTTTYLENIQQQGTLVVINYRDRPHDIGSFLPEHTWQFTLGNRLYLTQGKAKLYAQPMVNYYRHWGWQVEDTRILTSRIVTGCCPPAPAEVSITQNKWSNTRSISHAPHSYGHWGANVDLGLRLAVWRHFHVDGRLGLYSNWNVPFNHSYYYGSRTWWYRCGLWFGVDF